MPWIAQTQNDTEQQARTIETRVVVAAHGSWDAGELPTHIQQVDQHAGDLLGFKAHFANSGLAPSLMPLLAFPGGYGGMVHCDEGRVSLSCCVRRDCLATLRATMGPRLSAGEAVETYLREVCFGVRQSLAGSSRLGPWLATGPIRPGIRLGQWRGLFVIGNCAGEAHPVVAEGISMAIQSAWLLAERLEAWRRGGGHTADLASVHRAYSAAWRRAFAPRLRVSTMLAHWAMRPALVAGALPVLACFPHMMTWAAHWTGKARCVA
jgi:menaquinone-9 beta-reductase